MTSALWQTWSEPLRPDLDVTEYEISHMVVEFNHDDYSTRLNVGIARSGTWSLPIGVYFDYNGDGLIDSDMAMKFAGDIPLMGGLPKSAANRS